MLSINVLRENAHMIVDLSMSGKMAIRRLKPGKRDGIVKLASDNFIHGSNRLFVLLSLLFKYILCHGFAPNCSTKGTMIPILKDESDKLL